MERFINRLLIAMILSDLAFKQNSMPDLTLKNYKALQQLGIRFSVYRLPKQIDISGV